MEKQIVYKKEKKFISLVVYLYDVVAYLKYFLDTVISVCEENFEPCRKAVYMNCGLKADTIFYDSTDASIRIKNKTVTMERTTLALVFFGIFALQTIILKYLSVVLNLVFKQQRYLVADIEKVVKR